MIRSWLRRFERLVRSRQAYKFFIADWTGLKDIELCAAVFRTMRLGRIVEPLILERPKSRRVLVLAPHTDDETIGPGGTLLKAIAAGADVQVVYLTTNAPKEATRAEAAEASRMAGYSISFLDLPVGAIPVNEISARRLADSIHAARPDHLFLPFMMDDSNDHRRTNELLLAAARIRPLRSDIEVWAYQVYGVVPTNVMVDISEVADAKADLIRCWGTQMKKRDWAHYALGMNAFNSRSIRGQAGRRYGEAFFVLPLHDYLELCTIYFATPCNVYHPASYAKDSI